MSKHTLVVSGDTLFSLKNKTLLSTQNLLNSMIEGRQFFSYGNRVVNCQKIDVIRWMSDLNSGELGGLSLRNLLINSVVSSEIKQGGSGVICLITLMKLLKIVNQDKALGKSLIDFNALNEEIDKLALNSRRVNTTELFEVIKHINKDLTSYEIFKRTILAAGGDGSVYIEKNATDNTIIHGRHGYRFPGIVPDVFLAAAGSSKTFTWTSPKICVIDGIIERVSEINGLIHSSYKNNTPLIIVARGYNDDVQNTLGVNFSTGNLSVVPFCVPYDAFGANLVNDICVVSGCDIISSLKGDIISSVLWDDVPTVEKASIDLDKEELVVENNSTKNSVTLHKNMIRTKMLKNTGFIGSSESDNATVDVCEKRLSCLMSEGVRLSVGSDLKDSWGITKDRVETQIKIFKDGAKFGTIKIDDTVNDIQSPILKDIMNTLKTISPILTSRCLFSGLKTGVGAAKMIGEVGGIVYFDKQG